MSDQFGRKISLILFKDEKALDLSQFRIRFNTTNADFESPNSLAIRVYNLSDQTIHKIQGEFSQVVLNAGYETGNFGVIFQGSIKQFKIGRESNKDNYLDIYAADGDLGFNYGVVNTTLAARSTVQDQIRAIVASMPDVEIDNIPDVISNKGNQVSLRGKTLFGMSRIRMRNIASTLDVSWSIDNGKVVLIPTRGYLPGEVVKINVLNGLIGVPERTEEGIKLTCLLNSKLRIGGLIRLNNSEIAQLVQQNPEDPTVYNFYKGFQLNAPLSKDGTYRLYSVEHEGDSRGREWYSKLTALAVDVSATPDKAVKP